jgi:hypothetical protein
LSKTIEHQGNPLDLQGLVEFIQRKRTRGCTMKELIKLYSVKLQTGYITDAEIEQYEELIQLYMVGMKRRLQGVNNDNR